MEEDTMKTFIAQGKVLAAMAIRISVLEELLLKKNILTTDEVVVMSQKFSQDFSDKAKAIMTQDNNNKK
jgi:hypothetical protein